MFLLIIIKFKKLQYYITILILNFIKFQVLIINFNNSYNNFFTNSLIITNIEL